MASSSSRSRPRPLQHDLVTRIHNDALETPTTLLSGIDISNNQVHEDPSSSESESDFQRSCKPNKLPPRHARSISNPFPSFLSRSSTRHTTGTQARAAGTSSGSGHDGAAMAASIVANPKHKRNLVGSKEFATGNCMTCGSLMRWPKDLKVFKCTICATINDLAVLGGDLEKSGFRGRRRESLSQTLPDGPTKEPISLLDFQRVAKQCIRSYLSKKLVTEQAASSGASGPCNESRCRIEQADVRQATQNEFYERSFGATAQGEYIPKYVFEHQPTLKSSISRPGHAVRSYSSSYPERPPAPAKFSNGYVAICNQDTARIQTCEPKRIFKPLEECITRCFSSYESVNSSFVSHKRDFKMNGSDKIRRKPVPSRARSQSQTTDPSYSRDESQPDCLINQIDAKMLLLGDVAENGLWWTGGRLQLVSEKLASSRRPQSPQGRSTAMRCPNLDWDELESWYDVTVNPAKTWFSVYEDICNESTVKNYSHQELQIMEQELLQGQSHAQRVLLKAIESLLKRPGRPLTNLGDVRFLLIIAECPLLYSSTGHFQGLLQQDLETPAPISRTPADSSKRNVMPSSGPLSGQHSGIVKRVIGLLSNTPPECHNQLIAWFAKFGNPRFTRIKDLVSGFLSYRLLRQIDKKHPTEVDITAGLIPEMRTGRSAGGFYLHDEIRSEAASKKKEPEQKIAYTEDWQIKAASRVLALLFAANNSSGPSYGPPAQSAGTIVAAGSTRQYGPSGGQLLPTSDFYNSMVDYADLVSDFESWESKRTKFSFCQYPFLMSLWAKTRILEHDARRQMQKKARDAFLDSIMTNRNIKQYLSLHIRRDCLVEDSLAAVSEVIGSGGEDIKKGLRITFKGEEGIDSGGLRKEWFLLLVREVFNPDHGLFLYDEDSQYCYFNPSTFETSDQFFLVGVVMGLAIYNSTILDVPLPSFAFRKLLAAAPAHGLGISSSRPRPWMQYTLNDLAEYRPRVAHGLRQLLDFEGDVENTFCLDFVINTEKYDTAVQVPLCPGGERKPVTNNNRREYVELYVRYLLDTAVTRQFEPFKRGFYTVCGGNAFSLLRPEEIELLIRGSDEALDIQSLRAVAEYDNWPHAQPDGTVDVVGWFWETFLEATAKDQRKLLSFITGSDRIPATGASMLSIKISCLGEDTGRYPIARTCFNMISLWEYGSKQRLEEMLWRAVFESEGFGLK